MVWLGKAAVQSLC